MGWKKIIKHVYLDNLEDEENYSSIDHNKIEEFEKSIIYKKGQYYVSLPWDKEKFKLVPSNYEISLSVLDRVVKKLEKQNLLLKYNQVFFS